MTLPLTRLQNNLWSFASATPDLKAIRIQTPAWGKAKLSYLLAQAIAKVLDEQNMYTLPSLENGFSVDITSNKEALLGKWRVSLVRHDSYSNRFWQSIPATRRIQDKKIACIEAIKDEKNLIPLFAARTPKVSMKSTIFSLPNTLEARLNTPLFADPFTQAAAICLQTLDPHFVSEKKIYETYRFVPTLLGGVFLQKISRNAPTEIEQEENRYIVERYKKFILEEFGSDVLTYIESSCDISFEGMIERAAPLTPDHVFKTNIAANYIELGDLQRIFEKLTMLQSALQQNQNVDLTALFCYKDLRKLCQRATGTVSGTASLPTKEELIRFLASLSLPFGKSVQQLEPAQFNQLAALIMPQEDERERAYTGRKILLTAIHGTVTLGNPEIYNPTGDLFDTLQLFTQFQKTEDWENYCQLLSHVTSKKSLFRQMDGTWRIGLVIPAPNRGDNQARFYYHEAFIDDNEGNVHSIFLPACKGYRSSDDKALPFIKAYRSTSSHKNNVNWLESLAADLNPYGSPASLNPRSAFLYEKHYFDERTIPIWVSYLLKAKKSQNPGDYEKALSEYHYCIEAPGLTPFEKRTKAESVQSIQDIDQFLSNEALLHKELPQFKVAQDLFIVGHSLGAALAQFGTYYFGARRHRIPLPGYRYYIYASRAPGMDTVHDKAFMHFGKTHAEHICQIGPRWKIHHDLSYGDFVPQTGQSHMGTTGYDETEDSVWLDIETTVFRPLESASSLDITTLSAHEQRTGAATEGLDYWKERLSVQTLSAFDHSYWMHGVLLETFGFRFLRSSKALELARRIIAIVSYPISYLGVRIYNHIWPPLGNRDAHGVWALQFTDIKNR